MSGYVDSKIDNMIKRTQDLHNQTMNIGKNDQGQDVGDIAVILQDMYQSIQLLAFELNMVARDMKDIRTHDHQGK